MLKRGKRVVTLTKKKFKEDEETTIKSPSGLNKN
jgi:hypothetical protein